MTFADGTGRFAGAYGSFTATLTQQVVGVDPETGQVVMTSSYVGTGTITY